MYEFKTKFSNDDDDSDWEACDVISEISSDAMCTVVSRRDGRMAFVKRENVRFLGATLVKGLKDLWNSSGSSTHDAEEENDENAEETRKKKKRKIQTDDKENDSPTCSDVPPSKKWKPWISERVWAKWRGNSRSRAKSYYGATVQEKYKSTYSIQYDDGT